jgi:hypothetical protein
MRPLPQRGFKNHLANGLRVRAFTIVMFSAFAIGGCANVAPLPSPPNGKPPGDQDISVTVTPSSATVFLGNQVTFVATVKNNSDSSVLWSVNDAPGGAASVGTISAVGVYTAPVDLPVPANLVVMATSHANSKKSGSATILIQSDVVVTLPGVPSGGVGVELGAVRTFTAVVSSAGRADAGIAWSLTGSSCPLACGSVDTNGKFTAPRILPSPATVTLTARSLADPAKQTSTAVTITSNFTRQLSVPASVAPGAAAAFLAILTAVPGSNPDTTLLWSLSGTGCSGISCGTLAVVSIQSTGGNATATTASYTAPAAAPAPGAVTLTVTPVADPSKAVQRQFVVQGGTGGGGISVTVSPAAATRAINRRVTLTAQVTGTTNTLVNWNVNGSPGGSSAAGQICVLGSSPCQVVTQGVAGPVEFLAPAAVPTPDPVTVQAVSAADVTKSGSAQITIINHVLVSILPGSASIAPLGVQVFAATVLGSDNQNVVWQVQGAGCATPGICGEITPGGFYTAPSGAPSPDAVQVVAISVDDPAQSGAANVSITTGANILTLHPASVYAGAANGFTVKVIGSGFVPSAPGPGSTLLIGGTARTTTCSTVGDCIAPVGATDVAVPDSVSVQVQNPDGSRSNAVALVVAPPNLSDEVISLTTGSPDVAGKDIVVVEPTTAGVSVPGNNVDLDVAALGIFSTAKNSCTLGGNPILLTRSLSGVSTADICIFAQSGLDASMTYTVSGPGDVVVIAKQPLGLGIIRLTLQLPASAAASARTLFIQNTNLDKTAASGMLWVN